MHEGARITLYSTQLRAHSYTAQALVCMCGRIQHWYANKRTMLANSTTLAYTVLGACIQAHSMSAAYTCA